MTIFGRTISLNMLVLLLLVVIAFTSSGASLIVDSTDRSAEWWSGWLQNFSTEIIGAIATFALFELLVGGRKEKEKEDQAIKDLKARLIREAGSKDNATALNALREIKERGWLSGKDSILEGTDLRGANLKCADLSDVNMEDSDLFFANMEGTNLTEANLKDAGLIFTRLEGANLWSANLKGADLAFTRLEGADLESANLEGANLIFTSLQDAILNETKLENAFIHNVFFSGETILPNGEAWTPETDMTQFGCFVDRDKYLEWRKSQIK